MPTQRELHNEIDEARERYRTLRHRDLTPYKNEDEVSFARRRHRWLKRQEHLDDLIAHLRAKAVARGKARHDRKDPDPDGDGLATFDGKTVAAWMIPWLEKSRKAGWDGTITSGYRDPAYSESLCMNMCGKPFCPGLCAGKTSNHSGKSYPAGAIDVTDYSNFERIQFEIGSPLRNDLPLDPVHFSVSGH